MISKITITEDPEFTRRFPGEYNCYMEVTDSAGHTHVAETRYPKGHRFNPLDDSEVEAKFRRLSADVLTPGQCDQALQLIWSLEELPALEDLFDSLAV